MCIRDRLYNLWAYTRLIRSHEEFRVQPRPQIQLAEDQKRLLHLLRGETPRSRIEISRLLDINNGVVTRLARELISLGLVADCLLYTSRCV